MALALLTPPLLPSAAMLVVYVRRDGHDLRSHHFEQSEISVGRVHGQEIELPSKDVSLRHARIAWRGDRVFVTDNGSTNGTTVNGGRVHGTVEGRFSETTVEICGYELSFEITEGITEKAPRRTDVPTPVSAEITPPNPKLNAWERKGPPTPPALRKLVELVLPADDEFDAFCLDYFREIYTRFTAGMSHVAKQNLLLQLPREDVMQALIKHSSEKVQRHQHVLEYEP